MKRKGVKMEELDNTIDAYVNNNIVSVAKLENDEYKNIFNKFYPFFKRLLDIIAGICGSLIIIPLFLIIKIIYMLNKDFAPIMFKQQRVGKNGKIFSMYKFRTMVVDADRILKDMLKNEELRKEWEENQKFHNDPRITKCGNILRKTSLDEIPQFFNLLKGDMSLIGPRPLVKGELLDHNGNPNIYEKVRPGISGLWASTGRSQISYEERLMLEYEYVENYSFKMDMKCVINTIHAVITKKGAK